MNTLAVLQKSSFLITVKTAVIHNGGYTDSTGSDESAYIFSNITLY